MIQANELRIGNLVNDQFKLHNGFNATVTIVAIPMIEAHFIVQDYSGNNSRCYGCDGIPLTEEWLLKMGFEFDIFYQKHTNGTLCVYWVNKICLMSWCKEHRQDILRHKYPAYVHQLQNLYFALTGEELTIKP